MTVYVKATSKYFVNKWLKNHIVVRAEEIQTPAVFELSNMSDGTSVWLYINRDTMGVPISFRKYKLTTLKDGTRELK